MGLTKNDFICEKNKRFLKQFTFVRYGSNGRKWKSHQMTVVNIAPHSNTQFQFCVECLFSSFLSMCQFPLVTSGRLREGILLIKKKKPRRHLFYKKQAAWLTVNTVAYLMFLHHAFSKQLRYESFLIIINLRTFARWSIAFQLNCILNHVQVNE